jgi:hypothetical protein
MGMILLKIVTSVVLIILVIGGLCSLSSQKTVSAGILSFIFDWFLALAVYLMWV